ncbi:MAG: methyltransferase domain-containing protein [Thermomicrobiales bacterium]
MDDERQHRVAAGYTASDMWQPDAIAQHQADRSAYLERIAATPFVRRIAAQSLDLLTLAPGQTVLEVGCGSGVFLPLLAREVGPQGRVVGLDHAPAFVAEARARVAAAGLAGVVTVEAGDAYHLPFPDAAFDAAHCERVLMHLDDPGAALREMARVVRPGGVVVAAEPDWTGIRIDHPDRAGFDLLYRRAMNQRHPDMGLTLYRRLAEAGLVERRAALVVDIFTAIDTLRAYGVDLRPAAEALVAEGALEPGRAAALQAYLDEASAAGRVYFYGGFHVVAGQVPDRPPA